MSIKKMKFLKKIAPIALALAVVFGGMSFPKQASAVGTVTITMSDYALTVGETATVTFRFSSAPTAFTTADISAENGTISGLAVTSDPRVYAATFTPTAGITDMTNVIRVRTSDYSLTTYPGTGDGPNDIAFDGTNMWTANYSANSVTKVKPDGTMTTYTGTGLNPHHIAFDGTNMWTANEYGNSVTKISPTGVMTTYTGTGLRPQGIAFDGTNMWTANWGNSPTVSPSVTKISPTGVMTTYSGAAYGTSDIAFDGTNMWTANFDGRSVTKISPTGVMTTYPTGSPGVWRIAFDGTNMWTANHHSNTVTKISPTGAVTTYTNSDFHFPVGIRSDGTNIWITNILARSVIKISPTGVMSTYVGTDNDPTAIASDGINMWTANNQYANSVTKIAPGFAGTSPNYTIVTVIPTVPPVVTTTSATSVTSISELLTGNLTTVGSATPVSVSFEYDLASSPTTYRRETTPPRSMSTTGSFTFTLPDLSCATAYHYRAKATSTAGTVHGVDRTFTTGACPVGVPAVTTVSATSITRTGAVLKGNLSSMGGDTSAGVGFFYGTGLTGTTEFGHTSPVTVRALGSFTTTLSDPLIECGTDYHFRAYATNSGLGTAYGERIPFTTAPCGAPLIVATVSALPGGGLSGTTEVLQGAFTSVPGMPTTASASFDYDLGTSGTTYSMHSTPVTVPTSAPYSATISGLICGGRAYHFRAKADSLTGTSYGTDRSFTTAPCALVPTTPAVETISASLTTPTNELLTGKVTDLGHMPYLDAGFDYDFGTSGTTYAYHAAPVRVSALGNYTVPIIVSCGETAYHYRATATNGTGWVYGADRTFTTGPCPMVRGGGDTGMRKVSVSTPLGQSIAAYFAKIFTVPEPVTTPVVGDN